VKKIAFVNQRYGLEIASGSEMLCRLLAERLKDRHEIEVLTTCALEDGSWANHYPEGCQLVEDVKVRRFPVEKNRDWSNYDSLKDYIDPGKPHIFEEEVQWIIDQGPYSPALFDFIHANYDKYDAIVFMTYLYYTSAICLLGIPNAIFMPTAHDEPAIRLPFYKESFAAPSAYIYNTWEEKSFLEGMFPELKEKDNIVGAFGLDIPDASDIPDTTTVEGPYILYAGRITPAKGCDELIRFFLQYKKNHDDNLKLVLIGKKDMDLPDSEDISFLGFVDEEEKRCLMKNAALFIIASHFESLSIVVLEALAVNTPVLVTSKSEVLKGHVERSRAGYCFSDYQEFAAALEDAQKNTAAYQAKTQNGPDYVRENYSWQTVISSIEGMVDRLGFRRSDDPVLELPVVSDQYYNRQLVPAFEENNIPIVMASDDNYAGVLAVALESVIDTASPDHGYDIVVMSDRMGITNKTMLLQMTAGYSNISLRFLEVADRLDGYNFSFTNARLSRATFMRLLIPSLFGAYSKLLYLDCDIVVRHDVADLYGMELGDNLFGAIRDTHVATVWKFRPNVETHLREKVKLRDPRDYFNAGILVINLKKLMEQYDSEKLFSIATSRKWMWEDQDVLNLVAGGRVKFLDIRWNFFWVVCPRVMQLMKCSVEYSRAMREPYIIHYASGIMPISRSGEPLADVYWATAKKTPFYELLLKKANGVTVINNYNQAGQPAKENIVKRKLVGMLKSFRDYGIVLTLKTIGIYLEAYMKYSGDKRHSYIHSRVTALRLGQDN